MKRRRENAELTMDLSIRRVWIGGRHAFAAKSGGYNGGNLLLLHRKA